jgi:hypothetical protein
MKTEPSSLGFGRLTQNRYPCRAASMVAISIFLIGIIAEKARFASDPPASRASVSARGVIWFRWRYRKAWTRVVTTFETQRIHSVILIREARSVSTARDAWIGTPSNSA